jgi:hypothetical protein
VATRVPDIYRSGPSSLRVDSRMSNNARRREDWPGAKTQREPFRASDFKLDHPSSERRLVRGSEFD